MEKNSKGVTKEEIAIEFANDGMCPNMIYPLHSGCPDKNPCGEMEYGFEKYSCSWCWIKAINKYEGDK